MTHTSGEWYAGDYEGGEIFIWAAIGAETEIVATVTSEDVGEQQAKANALGIAAFPDLLALAKDLKTWCELNRREGSKLYKPACAAIAKATEQP